MDSPAGSGPPDSGPADNAPLQFDAVMRLVQEEGLAAAAAREDLRPAEQGLLELLTAFQGEIPGAEQAAAVFAKRRQPEHRRRFRIQAGGEP
jgi:hypothetical protein